MTSLLKYLHFVQQHSVHIVFAYAVSQVDSVHFSHLAYRMDGQIFHTRLW